jgi:hypothetical protein
LPSNDFYALNISSSYSNNSTTSSPLRALRFPAFPARRPCRLPLFLKQLSSELETEAEVILTPLINALMARLAPVDRVARRRDLARVRLLSNLWSWLTDDHATLYTYMGTPSSPTSPIIHSRLLAKVRAFALCSPFSSLNNRLALLPRFRLHDMNLRRLWCRPWQWRHCANRSCLSSITSYRKTTAG